MKHPSLSDKLFIEDIARTAQKTKEVSRGMSLGSFIRMIRLQIGMSQKILSQRVCVPQATVSRIEQAKKDANVSTLYKILRALSCDLVMVPMLSEPIDTIRRKQAKKQAEKHVRYLKGTMSLEKQQPDPRMLEELLKQEEDRLLHGFDSELWED